MARDKEQRAVVQTQSIAFSGPIPPPAHLEQYERILPGAAERILKMAEEQSAHRRSLETKVIDSGVISSNRGLWFGFIIGLAGFSIVGYSAYLGYEALAGIIAALDLGSLVGVFVYGSRQRKQERLEKEQAVREDR